MNILIPICGKGERFLKEGYTEPKHLIKVGGRQMIRYVLDRLPIVPTYIVYHTRFDAWGFPDFIRQTYPHIQLIPISYQTDGAAETALYGISQIAAVRPGILAEKIVLMDCDTFYLGDTMARVAAHNGNGVVYFEQDARDGFAGYSYIACDAGGRITAIREKERISNCANTGIYIFAQAGEFCQYARKIMERNIRFKNEYYTSAVIAAMIDDGHVFRGVGIPMEHMISLGTPAQVATFERGLHAFLFDLDGTLVRSDDVYKKVWSRIIVEDLGLVETPTMYEDCIMGCDDHTALRRLGSDVPAGRVALKKIALFLEHIEEAVAIPGALEFMRQLRALTPHKIAIVTNCNRAIAEAFVRRLGLEWIDMLVIGEECSRPKPYPDPYQSALAQFQIPHTRAVIFEDSRPGILSAFGVAPKCIVQIKSGKAEDNGMANLHVADFAEMEIDALIAYDNRTWAELRTLLHRNLPWASNIVIHNNKLKGGFIADVIAVDVYEGEVCKKCVFKMQNMGATTRLSQMALALGLYEREYLFYEKFRDAVCVDAPRCHGIIKDAEGRVRGVLLERLDAAQYSINLDLTREDLSVSLRVVDRMAALHTQWTGRGAGLRKNDDALFCPAWGTFLAEKWPLFAAKWAHMLTPAQLEAGARIVADFGAIQAALSAEPLTLIHGDIKSANIFYRLDAAKEPCFIDWQYIAYGKGVQDLVFFMIESFAPAFIREHAATFFAHYLRAMPGYNERDFHADLLAATKYYPFFVAVWFGTLDTEDLIDVSFPATYIQKYFNFLDVVAGY